MASSSLVLVGRVGKAHGVSGELNVIVETENPQRFAVGARLLAGRDESSVSPIVVATARQDGKRIIVKFEGVDDRDLATGMNGTLLFVDGELLGDAESGGYWPHQIEGLTAITPGGRKLGRISRVHVRPAQDLWEVETSNGSVLVPAVSEIVIKVDLDEGIVVVDPPKGLFPGD